MTGTAPTRPVPYYSQWESALLVPEFITGARSAADDPLWQKSGAASAEEYAFWSWRLCGVACLRMALDHWQQSVPLVRELQEAGAYVRDGDEVKGLIYRPFAEYVTGRWGLYARPVPELPLADIRREVADGRLAVVSVHKTIRTLDPAPPGKGGHLVLIVGADQESVTLHNPSGLPGRSQEYAPVSWTALDRFYAGRGVVLADQEEGELQP
jgi:Peptidase_C39 like family